MISGVSYEVLDTLEVIKFSPLASEIINRAAYGKDFTDQSCIYGPRFCDGVQVPPMKYHLTKINVEVRDKLDMKPIENCNIKVFDVAYDNKVDDYIHEKLFDRKTDKEGMLSFPWFLDTETFDSPHTRSRTSMLRLVKANCPNYQGSGEWISVFDVQASHIFPHGGFDDDFKYRGRILLEMIPK